MEEKELDNQELEIDLIDLCKELKNNIALILAATVLFAAAAGAYIHFMTVPTYSYTRMIKLPENGSFSMSDREKLSYINILKVDMNNTALWKEGAKGRLANVDLVREKNINTNLITFQFSGTDPNYLKKASDEYMETAVKKLNVWIREINELNFHNRYREWLVVNELKDVRLMLNNSSYSSDSVQQTITRLKDRLDALDKNEYADAKIVDNVNASATQVSRKPLIKKSAALGFVLSIMFIVARYCWRKARECGIF